MQMITDLMNQTINELIVGSKPSNNFSLLVKYALDRRVTQTISTDTDFSYPFDNMPLGLEQLQSLYNTTTQCNSPTYLPGFYVSLIRLFTVGNSYKPRPIMYTNASGINPYL